MHDAWPVASWYVPAGHDAGAASLPAQKCPVVHALALWLAVPGGQK